MKTNPAKDHDQLTLKVSWDKDLELFIYEEFCLYCGAKGKKWKTAPKFDGREVDYVIVDEMLS